MFLSFGTLLSPLTGIVVDRLRRKRTLITVNALTALILLSLTTVRGAGTACRSWASAPAPR